MCDFDDDAVRHGQGFTDTVTKEDTKWVDVRLLTVATICARFHVLF